MSTEIDIMLRYIFSFTAWFHIIQAMTTLLFKSYPADVYKLVRSSAAVRESSVSVRDCAAQCIRDFGSSCKSIAYSESVQNCIISSDFVFSTQAGLESLVTISWDYQIYSRGSCPRRYKYNPNTGTCVGLYTTALSWTDAAAQCDGMGEYMLTLSTLNDAVWLYRQISMDPDWQGHIAWLGGLLIVDGGSLQGSVWEWRGRVNNTLTYDFFSTNGLFPWQPMACLVLRRDDYMFYNLWCAYDRAYFCETDVLA